MLAILIAHAIAAIVAPVCVRFAGRNAFFGLSLVPLTSLGWVIANWGSVRTVTVEWVPGLSMDIDLRFDALSAIMASLVLGIGSLILMYCARYFTDDEPRLGVFAAQLVAFAGAMFGLVTSDNLLVLYTFWEMTTVLSFLLVGHYAERATSRRAATQALLVTTAGGLAMLVGFIILGEVGNSYLLSELIANPPSGWLANVAIGLVLVGALSKSAVVPMHFWLPGAMAAPTPVSAYLHAAAMVKAGIYLVARLAPGFADTAIWHPVIVPLGLASMLIAGRRALQVHDLKLLLAFGTVSQLGFLTVLVGTGSRDVALAGMAMVVAHAFFKAALFMVVGIIDHSAHTRDIRKLAHLGRRLPWLAGVATLAAMSMAGLPPFLGFVGKEAAFASLADTPMLDSAARVGVVVAVVVGSVLTMAYSVRFVWDAFGDKGRREPSAAVRELDPPRLSIVWVPGLLALGGLVAGIAASTMDDLLAPYADTLRATGDYHLALWHGVGFALWASVVVTIGGVLVYLVHERLRWRRPLLGNADRAYDTTLRVMDRISLRMTSSTQRGSLPVTQAVILTTLVALPMIVLAVGTRTDVALRLSDSPTQLAVGAVMIATAIGATVMRNRLAGVLLVGVVGYGCGLIFALHGAPDLALTQMLVETLTLVIFVLVLRKLPAEVDDRGARGYRVPRALLAIAVGVTLTVLAAFATSARTAPRISLHMPDAAYLFGNGKNVVNVLLVDIRAWDTLGEVSVLLVAATGVASLVFRSRRFGSAPRVADATPGGAESTQITWLRGGDLVHPRHRSLVLEITTRLVFPTIMVLSVYFFFAGHNAPGGGFAGGLTAGLALVLRYLAGGRYELGEALPVDAGQILGAGLVISTGTAVASLFLGAPVLSSATFELTLPLIGDVKLVTALFFDLGVYLIVVGLVLDVLRSLGARLDSPAESASAPEESKGVRP